MAALNLKPLFDLEALEAKFGGNGKVADGRLTVARLTALMHDNPRRIFGLPDQPDTRVEVDMTPYAIPADGWQTKCGWTPFAGLTAGGRVSRVVLRGEVAYENGRVLAAPGSGRVI